jgi:hypothetical protein
MPGTPGTLSVASPASACTSTTLSGATPNFSITSGCHGSHKRIILVKIGCPPYTIILKDRAIVITYVNQSGLILSDAPICMICQVISPLVIFDKWNSFRQG